MTYMNTRFYFISIGVGRRYKNETTKFSIEVSEGKRIERTKYKLRKDGMTGHLQKADLKVPISNRRYAKMKQI